MWSDSDDEPVQQTSNNPFSNLQAKKFKVAESSESENEQRVVKTQKVKLTETLEKEYKKLKKAVKDKEFFNMQDILDSVINLQDDLSIQFTNNIPEKFYKIIHILSKSTANIEKEDKKGLSQKNNRSLNYIRNKLKKNSKILDEIATKKMDLSGESEDDSEIEETKSLKSVSSVEEKPEITDPQERRKKWMKKEYLDILNRDYKAPETAEKKLDEDKKTEEKKEKKRKREKKAKEFEEQKKEAEINDETISKEICGLSDQRGHLQSKPDEILGRIDQLIVHNKDKILRIQILHLYVNICFDTSPGQFSALNIGMWKKIYNTIINIIEVYDDIVTNVNPPEEKMEGVLNILKGSLVSFLEKLELELYKALQFTDFNISEYSERITDEIRLIKLCKKVETFYKSLNDQYSISRIYMIILTHVYYKNEDLIKKIIEKNNIENDEYLTKLKTDSENFIDEVCNQIYLYCDEKSKIKAMLFQVYFFCIYNKYQKARDLFKRSNLFDVVSILKDDHLKLLYNRTQVQLGLCSFRKGYFEDSLQYLNSLCNTGTTKLKEYLSQTYNKDAEKNAFFDKEEKKRMIPYIMTINIDEIECTYLIASMILELPNIILLKMGKSKKNVVSILKKLLDSYDKQIFNGPPESNKELILNSASFMMKGDWESCSEKICSLKIFNHHKNNKEIKGLISEKIKESALKCFLFFYSGQFLTISLKKLCERFFLNEETIKRLINKIIIDNEFNAKWNDNNLSFYHIDNNFKVSNRLLENLNNMTDLNINLLEVASKK